MRKDKITVALEKLIEASVKIDWASTNEEWQEFYHRLSIAQEVLDDSNQEEHTN